MISISSNDLVHSWRSFMKEMISRFENISIFERNCTGTYHTWLSGKFILKLEKLGQIWNLCKENFDDSQTFCSRYPLSHLPLNISSLSWTLTQIKSRKCIELLSSFTMATLFGLSWDFLSLDFIKFSPDLAKYAGGGSLVGFFFRFAARSSSDFCTKHANKCKKQIQQRKKQK